MASKSPIDRLLNRARAHNLEPVLASFLDTKTTTFHRVQTMKGALGGPAGQLVRKEVGGWIVDLLAELVPETYAPWRALVHDAMLYVVLNLSRERLAPKLVQQMELSSDTAAERRLMLLIAKVPGLQKLGQVLARNRELRPSLRHALSKLENGISDMGPDEVRAIIFASLGRALGKYSVEVRSDIFFEASVSAVVRFKWRNPESGHRELGVFKVMKPYIPEYYVEDMELLQGLAEFLRRNHRKYGVAASGIADTFRQVRRLLQHEIDFRGEQRTLVEAQRLYGSMPGVRVPRVIPPLCCPNITALTKERGVKITNAVRRSSPMERRRIASLLVETLIATPLFAPAEEALFYADPHAGNLLYDRRTGEIVILDWALTNTLSREQRRHLALLFAMVFLRDPVGVYNAVQALSARKARRNSGRERSIRKSIDRFMEELPLTHIPDSMDAMRFLQRLAFAGVRFSPSLILLRKTMFTLDGILHDIVGAEVLMDAIFLRHILRRWVRSWKAFGAPLSTSDWLGVQASALLCGSRWALHAAQKMLNRPRHSSSPRIEPVPCKPAAIRAA